MASLIFAGCTKSDRSAALDSLSPVAESPVTPATPMSVSFTTPVADSTLTTSSVLFQWSATGGPARTNNPYEVKVYSAANCAGAAASTGFVSSAQYTLTGLLHGAVKSVGITAYNTANTASTEVCSSSVTGNSLISTLQVPGATYLALDVDMSAGIVYVGASYGTTFFESIDISNETTPVLLKSVGASTTPSSPSTYSRGIAVYNNGQRLLVASDGGSKMELWNLTGNPRTGTWVLMGTITGLTNVRKIAKVDTSNASQTVVYLALRSGVAIVNIAEPAGTMSLSAPVQSSGYLNSGNGAIIGNWMLKGSDTTELAYLVDLSNLASSTTYAFPANGAGSNLWSSSVSSDGTKAFVGGITGGFFSYNLSTPSVAPVRTYRFSHATSGEKIRDSVFVNESGKTIVYAGKDDASIEAWDVSDITAPVFLKNQIMGASVGQIQGIRVNPTTHRAYVATSTGWFYIVNTEMLTAPTTAPVSY